MFFRSASGGSCPCAPLDEVLRYAATVLLLLYNLDNVKYCYSKTTTAKQNTRQNVSKKTRCAYCVIAAQERSFQVTMQTFLLGFIRI